VCGVQTKGLPEPGVSGVGPLPYQTPEGVGPPLFRGGPVAPEGACVRYAVWCGVVVPLIEAAR